MRGWAPAIACVVLVFGCSRGDPYDFDGDGVVDARDCDSEDPDVYPGAPDPIDGVDTNCDGVDGVDSDGDGFNSVDDCDDSDASINPAAEEVWGNDVDEDCDLATRPPQTSDVGCGDVLDAWAFQTAAEDALAFRIDTLEPDAAFDPWAVLLPGVSGALDPDRPDAIDVGDDELPCTAPADTFGCPWVTGLGVDGGVTLLVGSRPGTCTGDTAQYAVVASINQRQVDGENFVDDGEPGVDPDLDNDGSYTDEDCNDNNAAIYPGNWEDPDDGIDADCDGTDQTGLIWADVRLQAEAATDNVGQRLGVPGDVDGDGIDDLLVGAYSWGSTEQAGQYGRAYLVLSATLAGGGVFSLADADVIIEGDAAGDRAGTCVSGGDVDGDGLADVLVSAIASNDGAPAGGEVGLFLGSDLTSGALLEMDEAWATFVGVEADAEVCRTAVADFDGDGLGDVVINAYRGVGLWDSGETFVFFGATLAAAGGGLFELPSADLRIQGTIAVEQSGADFDASGDIDGDGRDDLLLGSWRQTAGAGDAVNAYLVLGSTIVAETDGLISLDEADVTFEGDGGVDGPLIAVAHAGDIDGDGLGEIVVGTRASDEAAPGAGKAILFLGSDLSWPGPQTLPFGDADVIMTGVAAPAMTGMFLSGAGDVDGDARGDFLVSSPGSPTGRVSFFSGATVSGWGASSVSINEADAAFVGSGAGWALGAGDFNGDGRSDPAIGVASEVVVVFSPGP